MNRQTLALALAVGLGILAGVWATGARPHLRDAPLAIDRLPAAAFAQISTRTPLADGRILLIGDQPQGSMAPQARILGADGHAVERDLALAIPRRWHSATAMPDGRILIWGGVDGAGRLVSRAEWFDPESGSLVDAPQPHLTPRAGHSATLLTDGRVLFAGGWSSADGMLSSAELYDPATGKVEEIPAPSGIARTATLTAAGLAALQGGYDDRGHPLEGGSVFDPRSNRFSRLGLRELLAVLQPPPSAGAKIMESMPGPGTRLARLDGPLSVRFSAPMDPATVNQKTLTLIGPQGTTGIAIHTAEGGRLAFVAPTADLLPGSFYALYVNGARSLNGDKVPMAAIGFDTPALTAGAQTSGPAQASAVLSAGRMQAPPFAMTGNSAAAAADVAGKFPNDATMRVPDRTVGYVADGSWYPGKDSLDGRWRINRPLPPLPKFEELHRRLPEHAAAVFGQVLRIDDRPVANVEVTIGAVTARTDEHGLFVLVNPPEGRQELYIDGSSAGKGPFEYGQLLIGVDVRPGQVTALTQQVFLPQIHPADRIAIDSPTTRDITVVHPELPGLEIQIPAGTVIRDHKGRIVKELALVPTPLDRAPYPVPANFPVYFTLQPGGAMVLGITPEAAKGMRVVYPNYTHASPGTQTDFYVYDPQTGWKTYGKGQVSADGRKVVPDAGVALYAEVGAGYAIAIGTATQAPISCGDGGFGSGTAAKAADPCDLATGRFEDSWTDFAINDVMPISLTRTYHQGDAQSHAFGIGMDFNYGIHLVSPTVDDDAIQLVLPNGVGVWFDRTSGSGSTGSWKNTIGASSFFGAVLTSGGALPESYILTMKDGAQYVFSSGAAIPNVLTAIRDRFGNVVTLTYSGSQLLRVTSPSGRYLSFTYDASNRITQITDHAGRAVNYTYNAAGTLQSATFPDGTSFQYSYDSLNEMLTVQDRRGTTVTTNSYDVDGKLQSQTLADGGTYYFYYTVSGPGGFSGANGADGCMSPTQCNISFSTVQICSIISGGSGGNGGNGGTGGSGGSSNSQSCSYSLDTGLSVVKAQVIDPRGVIRFLAFDSAGYPVSDTYGYGQADAQTYTFQRDPNTELVTSSTDPLERVTQFAYDADGNTTSTTYLAGTANAVTYSYSYTSDDKLASVTDPLGHTSTLSYTGGCLTGITDPLGHSTSLTCNGAGQPTSITDPLGHTTHFGYNGPDLTSITDPSSRSVYFQYDALGRPISVMDSLGHFGLMTYDSNDRIVSSTDTLGFASHYAYDGDGDLTSFTDPAGGVVSFSYDGRNRPITRSDGLLVSESASYDGMGNLLTATDRLGQTTSLAYDDLGRLSGVTYADSSTTGYTYDAAGRPTTVADSVAGTTTLSYDSLDRLIQQATPQGTVAYTYDAASRRTSLHVLGQDPVTYSYDAADRLAGLTNGTESLAYAYDAGNRRTGLTLPNGIQAQYSYDAANQLTELDYLQGSTILGSLSYAYDALGRRTQASGTLASDRLPAATSADFAYNAANRLTAANGASPSYDAAGQMTQDGLGHAYVWNARHQLSQILNGTTTIASFQYDAFGRRTQKTLNGTATAYLYDGDDPIQEQQGSSLNTLLTGPGTDERYARDDTAGRTYFLTDALGSTVALTDSSGTILQQYSYEPYGGYSTSSSTSFTNPYTYTGREDDQTGLYYYRARYYSPGLSRFVSEDPIGLAGGANGYIYGDDDPISEIDPSGNCPWCIGAAIGASIDLATQLAANGGNLHCVSWTQVGISAALGAVGGGFGGRGLTAGLRSLSNTTKGNIGEGLSLIENRLAGSRLIETQGQIPGGFTTRVDSTWQSFRGATYYVESKFGKSGLTKAQRIAANALGDSYQVERWGYPFFGRAGGYVGGTAGGLAGNSGGSGGCGCQ